MIRRIEKAHYEVLVDFLSTAKEYNQYPLGYLYQYGLEDPKLSFYGDFTEDELKAVVMKYFDYVVFYGHNCDYEGIGDLIMKLGFTMLGGKAELMVPLEPYIKYGEHENAHYCKLEKLSLEKKDSKGRVKAMKGRELLGVIEHYNLIKEFHNTKRDNEALRYKLEKGCDRGYYYEENGEVTAAVQSAAEYAEGAMVVWVSSSPRHRGRGHLSACLYKLCAELRAENKNVYLYYYNEKAGSIYRRLGFNTIGYWALYMN